MMSAKPKWRQVFDKVERTVGVPLEDLAASNRFVEVLAVGIKVRRKASKTVRRAVHGVAGTALHAINIPTSDDVRRLNTHLSSIAGEIRTLEQHQRSGAVAQPVRATRPGTVRSVKGSAIPRLTAATVTEAETVPNTKTVPSTKTVPNAKAVPNTKAVTDDD